MENVIQKLPGNNEEKAMLRSNISKDLEKYKKTIDRSAHSIKDTDELINGLLKESSQRTRSEQSVRQFELENIFRMSEESHKQEDFCEEEPVDLPNIKMMKSDRINAVMVCVGHHGYPNRIEFQDQEKFSGSIIHNHQFKDPKQYENKKVLVVGAGNSAVDAAVDLSYVAEKTYLSTRRGFWLWKRIEEYGIPYDINFINRSLFTLFRYVPLNLSCWYMERNFNKWFNHEMYQLTPSHRIMNQFPTVNDFLPSRILSGRIKIKGNIEKFTENGVIFENGEFIEVNEIILATGYKINYPFLKNIKIDNNHIELYKYIFPPDLKFPTLGIIGCVSVIGGYPVIGEIQCRYFTDVLNKKLLLPTSKEMKDDILKQFQIQKQLFYISERHNINVFYIDYLDEIANLIGVKPNIMKLFWTDPILFKKLLFGPCLPYQYRLQGTNAWSRAREAILSFDQRVLVPLRTRYNVNNKKNFSKK
ncbi:dimethylaniline monooxygenase [N-oxide-forming] 5-like, partial [Centruroides sculpturatus]|uniref:dimethylaniline monooxygenase [N-oxide-forming] 5-like n=1 Tax=Centruroides sculpturatus TaxID=218467 RepID=UPI000C6EDE2B